MSKGVSHWAEGQAESEAKKSRVLDRVLKNMSESRSSLITENDQQTPETAMFFKN
jgi:hypothetical protein